jgi:hypothetical protein
MNHINEGVSFVAEEFRKKEPLGLAYFRLYPEKN